MALFRRRKLRGSRGCLVVLLAMVSIAWGCSSNTEIGNPESAAFISLETDAGVDSYLREQLAMDIRRDVSAGEDVDSPAPGEIPASPDGFAETPSVENPVWIGEDAIFVAAADSVTILEPGADVPRPVGAITGTGTIRWLRRIDNRLVAVGEASGTPTEDALVSRRRVRVTIWNVSEAFRPEMLRAWEMDGAFVGAEYRDDRLFLVQEFVPDIPAFRPDGVGGTDAAENLNRLAALSPEALRPGYVLRDGTGNLLADGALVRPDDVFRPDWPAGGDLTTLSALNLGEPVLAPASTALVGRVRDRFLSPDAAVLGIVRTNGDLVAPPSPADSSALETVLYHIVLDRTGPRIAASGVLPGIFPSDDAGSPSSDHFRAITVAGSPGEGWSARAFDMVPLGTDLAVASKRSLGREFALPSGTFAGRTAWLLRPGGRLTGVNFGVDLADSEPVELVLDAEPIGLFSEETGRWYLAGRMRDFGGDGEAVRIRELVAGPGGIPSLSDGGVVPVVPSPVDARWSMAGLARNDANGAVAIPLQIVSAEGSGEVFFSGLFLLKEDGAGGLALRGSVDLREVLPGANLPANWLAPRFPGDRFGLFFPDGLVLGDPADPGNGIRTLLFPEIRSS